MVAEYDGDSAAERLVDDIEYLSDRETDVLRRNDGKSRARVYLISECHAEYPQTLIEHERHTLDRYLADEMPRNVERAERADRERTAELVSVRPYSEHGELDKARGNSRYRSAYRTEPGRAEQTEDEYEIQTEVSHDRRDACDHRDHGAAGLAKR